MSVGGKVIETIPHGNRIWVNTYDGHDQCAVYVPNDNKTKMINEGDSLWWQGGLCFWTAYDEGRFIGPEDVEIRKMSGSGVPKPETTN